MCTKQSDDYFDDGLACGKFSESEYLSGNGEAEKMNLCREIEVGTLDARGPITFSLWWVLHSKLLPFPQILK